MGVKVKLDVYTHDITDIINYLEQHVSKLVKRDIRGFYGDGWHVWLRDYHEDGLFYVVNISDQCKGMEFAFAWG